MSRRRVLKRRDHTIESRGANLDHAGDVGAAVVSGGDEFLDRRQFLRIHLGGASPPPLHGVLLRTQARSTVMRLRNIVSAFSSWAVDEALIAKNPALASRVPKGTGQDTKREIWPFTLQELRKAHADMSSLTSKTNTDILLVLGLTGIRWGELSALRGRDVQQLPYPAFRVSRSKPDGQPFRTTTKGGGARTVPLADEVWAIVQPLLDGRKPDDPLFASASGTKSVRAKLDARQPLRESKRGSARTRPASLSGDLVAAKRRGPEDRADLARTFDDETHRRHVRPLHG